MSCNARIYLICSRRTGVFYFGVSEFGEDENEIKEFHNSEPTDPRYNLINSAVLCEGPYNFSVCFIEIVPNDRALLDAKIKVYNMEKCARRQTRAKCYKSDEIVRERQIKKDIRKTTGRPWLKEAQ